jgi:hypothetical protein
MLGEGGSQGTEELTYLMHVKCRVANQMKSNTNKSCSLLCLLSQANRAQARILG